MSRINNHCKKIKNHHSRFIGLVVFYLLLSSHVIAGDGTKRIPLHGIHGTYIGGKNMSIEEIEKRAIDAAKVEALNQAGIEENITSYQNLYKSETNNSFDEIYTSDILADIQGAVTEIELENEPVRENTHDGMKITVSIQCVVVKYENTKDIEFDAEIEGLKKVYENEAAMDFSIKPTKDCYLKIFWISDKSESSILYPDDKNILFSKAHWYKFPEGTSYIVDTKFSSEVIRLLVVLLKKDVLFKDIKKPLKTKDEKGNSILPEVNYSNITNWLYAIPPSERKIITQSFTITK